MVQVVKEFLKSGWKLVFVLDFSLINKVPLIKQKIPEGRDVIQSLEVRVHVASVPLIDKAHIIRALVLLDFHVKVYEQV
jgi:hypothetical protein